jgi:hypothetical protein
MKKLIASVFALSLLGATATTTAQAQVGVGVHVGDVGVGAHIGVHHRRHECGEWGWRNRHHDRFCRRWYWR